MHIRTFAAALAEGDEQLTTELIADLRQSLDAACSLQAAQRTDAPPGRRSSFTPLHHKRSATAALPVAQLAERGVQFQHLFVWAGAPDTLHWRTSASATCSAAQLQPRPPSLAELSLPLCGVCARSGAAATQPAVDGLQADADSDPATTAASAISATTTDIATALSHAVPREQAEVLLLHLLLRCGTAERRYAAQLCREQGIDLCDGGERDGERGDETRVMTRLSTPGRRTMLQRLLRPPTNRRPELLLDEWTSEQRTRSDNATARDLLLLSKLPDSLQHLSAHWAQIAITSGDNAPRQLLKLVVRTLHSSARYEAIAQGASIANAHAKAASEAARLAALQLPTNESSSIARGVHDHDAALRIAVEDLAQQTAILVEEVALLQADPAGACSHGSSTCSSPPPPPPA